MLTRIRKIIIKNRDKLKCLFNLIGIAQQTIREDNACNCVRWNPVEYQDCLLEGYANGAVKYRQIKRNFTNKILAEFDGNENNINNNSRDQAKSVNCLEFLPSSSSFLSGRSDSLIKQYDITTGKELRSLNYHKNRVFALKHINEQCFLSAGWDHTVFLFDLRANKVQKYIYGPMVFGDALDFKNYQVLCGSWREHKQLEIFDLRNDSSEEVKWEIISKGDTPSYVYSCQFSKVNDKHIVAGSTGKYELRIFDREENNACIDAIDRTLTKGVFSLDFRNNSNSLSFGTSDGQYGLLEII